MSAPEFISRDIYAASLIQTMLQQTPDYLTFESLLNSMVAGADQVQAAQQVLASFDFTSRFGNLSDVAFVTLLYQNIFGRNPDTGGLSHWVSVIGTGQMSRAQAVAYFLNSAEFLGNRRTFARIQIACIYLNLFRRTPDEGGISGWTNAVLNGYSIAQVAEGFLTSPEFYARDVNYGFARQQYRDILDHDPDVAPLRQWAYELDTGLGRSGMVSWLMNSQEAFAKGRFTASLYQTLLGRPADMGGYVGFTGLLETAATKIQVAAYFIGSAEFTQRFGTLSNSQYVTKMYENILLREPDAGGLQGFVAGLSSGAFNRTQVAVFFLTSAEYLANQAAQNQASIGQMYVTLLRRGATQTEYDQGVVELNSGISLTSLVDGILSSAEYKARKLPF